MGYEVPDKVNLHAMLDTWVMLTTSELPAHQLDDMPSLSGRRVLVEERRVGTLVARLERPMGAAGHISDALAALAVETYVTKPLVSNQLGASLCNRLNAHAAAMLASAYSRGCGHGTFSANTVGSIVEALLAPANHLTGDDRRDIIRTLCNSEHAKARIHRPRPDPDNGPIISVGTPISFITFDQQAGILEIADAVESAVVTYGFQADVPGRFIHPGAFDNADLEDRDITARSALGYAAGFIGTAAEHSRRGMGFAVAIMEALGGPVLLMPGGVQEYVFARVFGARLAHREEAIYSNPDEAHDHALKFLTDHEACILERHANVTDARARLTDLTATLAQRYHAIDKAIFASMALTDPKARFLLEDPIHLAQALPWELKNLARALDVSPTDLLAEVYDLSALRNPRQADAAGPAAVSTPGAAAESPAPRFAGATVLTQPEYQAWRLAGEVHEDWDVEMGLLLLDEYMEGAVSAQTSPLRSRTHYLDWVEAYKRRFN